MNHGSLFSGIGGFDLAAQQCGWNNIFQVEINEFCQKTLEKNFPNTKRYKDVRKLKGKQYRNTIDVLTGGFPCQPFSVAGKQTGTKDNRYLWPQMLRLIKTIQPTWIVAENVYGLVSNQGGLVLENIITDLEAETYQIQSFVIPASSKNAPHKRHRIWIIAYSSERRSQLRNKNGREIQNFQKGIQDNREINGQGKKQFTANSKSIRLERDINIQRKTQPIRSDTWSIQQQRDWLLTEPGVCRTNDGVPDRVDRIKALGETIVPQIAFEIFKVIDSI